MTAIVPWAWLCTVPGLFLTGLGVGRPGAASIAGPAALLVLALGWLLGPRESVEVVQQNWLPFLPNGAFHLRADPLSVLMLAVVGLVSLCVYVYSLGYMDGETPTGKRRFFMYLDFFVASMAMLVLAGNLAVLLIGWAGVGLASFLLISFWHGRPEHHADPPPLESGLQALAANAVGDAALLLAIVLLPTGCGDLLTLHSSQCVVVPGGAATIAALLLVAAAAKSAQGPLYFWLPSAMAGPTPVSALIHAATMVAAGVYLLVRVHALIEAAPLVARICAVIGVATALAAGVASLRQSNFKRGLAYSTVSQLGYMFAGVGMGSTFAAIFHLVTHASFKALLFLSAGVVIHARHGEEQLARLGGLRTALPGAYLAFLVGSLALIGVPALSGAFSKDAILEAAREHDPFPPLLFLGLFVGVFITGWYIGRLFFGVFHGPPPRDVVAETAGHEAQRPGRLHEPSVMLWPLAPLAVGAILLGYIEWPLPLLSTLLGGTVGGVLPTHLISPLGGFAGLLGIAGFAFSAWRTREPTVARVPGVAEGGWVDAVAGLGYGLASGIAAIHSGNLGRYALLSVLAIAVVVLLGLLGSMVGVSVAIPTRG